MKPPVQTSAQSTRGPRACQGFTLVEMLAVMTIMVCLYAWGGNGLFSSNKAAALTAAGNNISDLTFLARQQAITKNTPVALTLLTVDRSVTQGPGDAFRAFALMELRNGAWVQVAAWKLLPEGIVVDTNTAASTFLQNATLPSFATATNNDSLTMFHGQSVRASDCAVRVFLPSGGMWNPDQAASLQMVEGTIAGNQTQYRRCTSAGDPINYYDIALMGVTGLSKVVRR